MATYSNIFQVNVQESISKIKIDSWCTIKSSLSEANRFTHCDINPKSLYNPIQYFPICV